MYISFSLAIQVYLRDTVGLVPDYHIKASHECFGFLIHVKFMLKLFIKCAVALCLGEGNGTPLQYSCLENPMDGGAWWAAVHGVTGSQTRLSNFTFTFHFHALEKEMATHSNILAWRIPWTGNLVGCHLWGHTESDTTGVTSQQQHYI